MAINKTLDIDISSQSAFIKMHIPQGDNIDRKFYINFLDGSNEYIIPSTAIVRFQMTKFNGTVIYNNCPVVNNQVEFDITPAISAESGRHPAQFKITDSFTGGELKSFKLHLLIEENVDIESVVVNTSEFTALQDMELRLGDADALLEAAIDNAGNATENANSKATLAQIAATNANDKAAFAQTKGDYANTKALEAENSATNANEKANYAQTKGDFAIEAGNRANEISNSVEAAEALRPKYIYLTRSEYDALPLSGKEDRNKIYEITDDDGQLPNELSNLINECQDATQAAWDASVGALPNIITPGTYNKVTVDSKGRVESASLESKISGLGVTDVYTKDDIDTKLVNINAEKLNIGNDYRPNLLINGNFQVWQRGESFTLSEAGTRIFTADRWAYGNSSGSDVITHNADGALKIALGAPNRRIYLSQAVEVNSQFFDTIKGEKVTLSFDIKADTGFQAVSSLYLGDAFWEEGNKQTYTITTSYNKIVKTFVLPTTITTGYINVIPLRIYSAEQAQFPATNVYIKNIKLEVNDHATPFLPSPYADELAMCQRYYFPLMGHTLRPFTFDSDNFFADDVVSNIRRSPTLIPGVKGTDWEAYGNVNAPASGFTINLYYFSGNVVYFIFTKPAHGLTMSNFYVSFITDKCALDAEI